MEISPEQLLLDALKKVKFDGPRNRLTGMCHNVDLELIAADTTDKESIAVWHIRRDLFAKWPSFSGDIGYPIADPNAPESANMQYTAAFYTKKFWDKRTRYARLRFELIDWMIEQLEVEIGQQTTTS